MISKRRQIHSKGSQRRNHYASECLRTMFMIIWRRERKERQGLSARDSIILVMMGLAIYHIKGFKNYLFQSASYLLKDSIRFELGFKGVGHCCQNQARFQATKMNCQINKQASCESEKCANITSKVRKISVQPRLVTLPVVWETKLIQANNTRSTKPKVMLQCQLGPWYLSSAALSTQLITQLGTLSNTWRKTGADIMKKSQLPNGG